ncbi:MAG: hypothetical protein RL716_856 [Actinomycetota bacterium]
MSEKQSKKAPSFAPAPEPLEVAVYDNHCHLWIENLDLAESVGVKGVLQVGVTLESSKWCAELATKDSRVLAAVALHPNEAPLYETIQRLDDAIAEIAELAKQPRVRAIGETGLDFFRTDGEASLALQQHSFEEHIRIAKENNIALMIHDRDAHDEVVATLKRVGAPEKVVFHCYSGETDLAQICIENGWYMSFAGNITIKRNQHLREPFRGRPNAPYLVPITARFMAETRGQDLNELCAQLALNTETVYGSWSEGF